MIFIYLFYFLAIFFKASTLHQIGFQLLVGSSYLNTFGHKGIISSTLMKLTPAEQQAG